MEQSIRNVLSKLVSDGLRHGLKEGFLVMTH
jgi:hypothetical protein